MQQFLILIMELWFNSVFSSNWGNHLVLCVLNWIVIWKQIKARINLIDMLIQLLFNISLLVRPRPHIVCLLYLSFFQYVPRPSVPVANNKAAPTGGGTKRNPGRQSHVITSNGHNKEQNVENQNGSGPHSNLDNSETMPPPKHVPSLPPDKSETVSKATGAAAAAAQAVSKYFKLFDL